MNLLGEIFGRLIVIEKTEKRINGSIVWKCQCDCGNLKEITSKGLRNKKTKSCGCLREERITTHKKSKSITYKSYHMMKQRCLNPNDDNFKYYGEIGIKICKRWLESFENFFEDMGERPKGTTLDRIDNNGHYEPSNCKWSTPKEQVLNRNFTKLNENNIIEIRKLLNKNIKQNKIAKKFDIDPSLISKIKNGKVWKQGECYEIQRVCR